MSLDIFWDERVLDHDTGSGHFDIAGSALFEAPELHPENAERVRNMRSVLRNGPIAPAIRWRGGRAATEAELALVHDPGYIASIRDRAQAGGGRLDGTTVISARSWEPILVAAGTTLAAVDAVLEGEAPIAMALVRPPGHHALPARAGGYCFFNHVALAAERARRAGCERVAIVDWDVHHGNGTQTCFYDRADVLTISLHMRTGLWGEAHPETGSPEEVGIGSGQGFNVNVELPIGSGDRAYGSAMREIAAPVLAQFEPDLLIGASGQDASGFDPNGRQNLSLEGFRRIGTEMRRAADALCGGRLLLVQEGGYARTYSAACLHATLEGVLDWSGEPLTDSHAYIPDDFTRARQAVESVQSAISRYWTLEGRP